MNESNALSKQFGATLLVAGSCIGAGMLAFPTLSALAGFIPSFCMLVLCLLFMIATGLLLLEVTLSFEGEVSIITMLKKTLGPFGQFVGWVTYLFQFYLVLVAYMAGIGLLVRDFVLDIFLIDMFPSTGAIFLVTFFSFLVYLGTAAIDKCNRLMMALLVLLYVGLLVFGTPHVQLENLFFSNWKVVGTLTPTMVLLFGYHNLVPSLATYLNKESFSLRRVIIVGSLISFVVYLFWDLLILGILSADSLQPKEGSALVTYALKHAIGSGVVVLVMHGFAFFAIVTSFVGVALSFVDFLADGLSIKKNGPNTIQLIALTLIPPFILAYTYPAIFIHALTMAGAFGTMLLFGILPVLMVWKRRYRDRMQSPIALPGGKVTLVAISLFALFVFVFQLIQEF